MPLFDDGIFDDAIFDVGAPVPPPNPNTCNILLQSGDKILKQSGDGAVLLTNCVVVVPVGTGCDILLQSGFSILRQDGDKLLLTNCVIPNGLTPPNGNRRIEYQPTYYELQQQRQIERKFEEIELDLKSSEIKIEELEFKRLSDLADSQMQLELLQLLAWNNELRQQLEALRLQKLRALQDDDEIVFLMAYLI